jgi:hypothetical protein
MEHYQSYSPYMNTEPRVARDLDGGVVVTLEHADGPPTIVSTDSPEESVVLRFISSHEPSPRKGAELRRYDILTGYWDADVPPMRHHYPMIALLGCAGCGRSIRCQKPEGQWEHVLWRK